MRPRAQPWPKSESASAHEHRLGLDAELAGEMAPVAAMMHALAHEDTDAEARVLNAAYKHAAAAAPGIDPIQCSSAQESSSSTNLLVVT